MYILTSKSGQSLYNGQNDLSQCVRFVKVPLYIVQHEQTQDGDDDEFSVVPGSQFVVSRTAHKDSSSYYCLDDRKKPFKEIATLLRDSGIDLDHNRFLILQVRVFDDIVIAQSCMFIYM